MNFQGVLRIVIVPTLWAFSTAVDTDPVANAASNVTHSTNSTAHANDDKGFFNSALNLDTSMIQRALYVLIGITVIGVLYFLVRAVRMKKPGQRKKYGLLSNYDDTVEMAALESDEDETVYEARSLRR